MPDDAEDTTATATLVTSGPTTASEESWSVKTLWRDGGTLPLYCAAWRNLAAVTSGRAVA